MTKNKSDDPAWQALKSGMKPLKKDRVTFVKKIKHADDVAVDRQVHLKQNLSSYLNHMTDQKAVSASLFVERRASKTFRHFRVEARLDLHGQTKEKARKILEHFLFDHYHKNVRHLLIITGKGKSSQDDGALGEGVLKSLFPSWLNEPNLRQFVSAFCQASDDDGGSGAFYVLLRRL